MNPTEAKNHLNKLLESDTIFCFENVEMSAEIIDLLISKDNLKKIYFIRYDQASFKAIKEIITNREVVLIDSLTHDIISNSTVVFCLNNSNYFNPNYSLIVSNKTIKGICFLGFPESAFRRNPVSKEMLVVNKQLIDLLQVKKTHFEKRDVPDLEKSRFCRNRTNEKLKMTQFLANPNERLLVLHGFPGYGKSNLLDELIRNAPNRKYYHFNFQDRFDTYKDIINELSPSLSFTFQQEELLKTNISNRGQSLVVSNFINKFNEKENTTLVFDGVEKVLRYENNNVEFVSRDLEIFFERLITNPNFNFSNKIVFLGRMLFTGNYQIRNYKTDIPVGTLQPYYIKLIMADEYNRLNKPDFAVKIGNYNDVLINRAIGGHPVLALRFIDASLKHGIDAILNNEEFKNKISSEIKIKWLLDNYPLEQSEKTILEIIGLFSNEVPTDFIRNKFPDSHHVIEQLITRYLLDAKFMKDGSVKYYVPSLIKDYISGITDDNILKKNHLDIGDYFWEKAEDITASSFQKISAYRKAFYHYNLSGDKEKIKLLSLRFKEKFLLEARESAKNKNWEDAYFFFNELHENGQLNTDNARDYNEFLKALSRMSKKPVNADALAEEIHSLFLYDSFIAITYADYWFDKQDPVSLLKVIEECERIKKLIENQKDKVKGNSTLDIAIIDNTAAKALFKLNKQEEATEIINKWEVFFEQNGVENLNEKEKYHYQALLMTRYRGNDDFNNYYKVKQQIIEEMNAAGNKTDHIPFLHAKHKTYCLKNHFFHKIKEQFEKAKALKQDEAKMRNSYSNFIANAIEVEEFQKYLDSISKSNIPVSEKIKSNVEAIEHNISKGLTTLRKIKTISPKNNFPAEYALCGLLEVEADFYLLKEVINKYFINDQ